MALARRVSLALALLLFAAEASAASRRALLIGINDYEKLTDLRGSLNDIEIVSQVLQARFGFAPAQIVTVTDRQATRDGILKALADLASVTQPDDVVYIHYSGHGSQASDANKDDATDGMDETIVPQNGRTPNVPDITDDELAVALAKIRAHEVVIVLDSCHSGTATRGITALRHRSVPADTRDELYAATAIKTRSVVPLAGGKHLLMTGAASSEEALDGPVDGRPQGLFTYSLVQAMKRSAPGATPRDVFAVVSQEQERIKAQLGLRNMPEPQLEGEAARLDAPLLAAPSASAPPRVAWLTVRAQSAGVARLVGGAKAGAAPGSVWAIYAADEVAFAPGRALAEARVTASDAEDAIASLEPREFAVPSGARAAQVSLAPASDRIPVLIVGDAARRERIRKALEQQVPGIQFAREGDFARFVIDVKPAACTLLGADASSVVAEVNGSDDAKVAAEFARLLSRSMTATELLAIHNPSSTIRLSLSVADAATRNAQPGGRKRGATVVADGKAARFKIRRPGQPRSAQNSLQLTVTSTARCYLSVVDVDVSGGVHLLFPNSISEARGYVPGGLIEANQPARIPDSLEPGNRAGFFVDYSPPAGTDTLRAFCAADRAVAELLRTSIASLDTDAGATRSATRGVLGVDLRDRLAKIASRGMRLVADAPEPADTPTPTTPATPPAADWAAASLTLIVED